MRSFTVDERRARLARRHFLAGPAQTPAGVAGDVVGLHATDPATPYLSLWARLPGFTVADLDDALYRQRTLTKHLAMRRTLWIVRAEDLPLIQSAASDRVAGNEHRKLVADAQNAGIAADGERLARGGMRGSAGSPRRTRADQRQRPACRTAGAGGHYDPAPGKRWGGETPLAPRVLTVLSVRGDIVRGPNDGRLDRLAAAVGVDGRLAADDARRRASGARADRNGAPVAARVRPGDRHRHQMVVRQHADLGAAGAAGHRCRRGGSGRHARLRPARRPRGRAAGRAVVCAAARPRRHDDGLVRPRLVSRRAPRPGVRHQRQRRPDGVVRRPHRRRLGSGRRWPCRGAAARGRRPGGAEGTADSGPTS